jgi:hypothetical protein
LFVAFRSVFGLAGGFTAFAEAPLALFFLTSAIFLAAAGLAAAAAFFLLSLDAAASMLAVDGLVLVAGFFFALPVSLGTSTFWVLLGLLSTVVLTGRGPCSSSPPPLREVGRL